MLPSQRTQYETTTRRGNVQHLAHVKEPKRPMPSQIVLDQAADRKLDGGYNVRKSNICSECFETKSVNGSCGC